MSTRIVIPSYLRPYTGDTEIVEVNGSIVSECLDQLVKQFPNVEKMLFTNRGKLHGYVGIYVNGEDAFPEGLDKPLKDGDELHVIYMIGGG